MVPEKKEESLDAILELVTKGDLSELAPEQLLQYYLAVCKSLRLNPLTRPFEFLQLRDRQNNKQKLVMYATRTCADQLRRNYNISTEVVSAGVEGDIYVVRVRGRAPDGRVDENIGAVPMVVGYSENGIYKTRPLTPSERANAIMTAHTKAQRRLTLSMCGLGMLSEEEAQSLVADGVAAQVQAIAPDVAEKTEPQTDRDLRVEEIRNLADKVFEGETPQKRWAAFCLWAQKAVPRLGSQGLEKLTVKELDILLDLLRTKAEERSS